MPLLIFILMLVIAVMWSQLLQWRDWKDEIALWIAEYQQFIDDYCDCSQDDPPEPPMPPEWPNGGWPH